MTGGLGTNPHLPGTAGILGNCTAPSNNTYNVGDQVSMVKEDPHRKLKRARFSGPYTVNQVCCSALVHRYNCTTLKAGRKLSSVV
jgi:hypothetical protein